MGLIVLKTTSISVGYGRNRAIEAAKGNYLCFQDIDDEMLPERISQQYNLAQKFQNAVLKLNLKLICGNENEKKFFCKHF